MNHLLADVLHLISVLGHTVLSIKCLTADMCLTAAPGVASSIMAWSHTFVEFDHEIISMVERKYVHEVLVNCLDKLAQVKSVVRRTDRPNMTKAVDWDIKHQNKQKHSISGLSSAKIKKYVTKLAICCHLDCRLEG